MKKVNIFEGKFASIMPAEIFTKKLFYILDMEFTGANEVLEISIQKIKTTTEGLEFGEIQTERFAVEGEVDTMSLSVHGITSNSNSKFPTFKEMWGKYKEIFQGHTLVAYGDADFSIIRDIDPNFEFEHIDLYEQCVAEFDSVAPYTYTFERVWSWTQAHMYTIIHSLENGGSFSHWENKFSLGDMSNFSLPEAHSSAGDVEMANSIFLYFLKEDLLKDSNECVFYRCPYGKYKGEVIRDLDTDNLVWMYEDWDLPTLFYQSVGKVLEARDYFYQDFQEDDEDDDEEIECPNCGAENHQYKISCWNCSYEL